MPVSFNNIQTCAISFFRRTAQQVVNDSLKMQPGGKKRGGNQTGANQKAAPPLLCHSEWLSSPPPLCAPFLITPKGA